MDLFSAMRVYVRVVESRNFTRAALRLGMPKATVTTYIQGLEAHLKTKLLNRTTRQVLVTNEGAVYYEQALRIIAEVDELDATFHASQGKPTGRIRVEMAGGFFDYLVIPYLSDFNDRYPDIALDVGISDRNVDYLAENVDVALRAGTPPNHSLISKRVSEVKFLNGASPGYVEKYGLPKDPTDLEEGHRIIGYLTGSSGHAPLLTLKKGPEIYELQPKYELSVSDHGSYMAAAKEGHGIIQAPNFMIKTAFQKGELVPILAGWEKPSLPLCIVYPPNRHLSNKIRIFVDWVTTLVANTNPH
ncbi:DNA-binding transcriptional LysR family regulator [Neorhizobium galegae]|uniref:LysR family transcriptional regulator n=1 Tax=Neorhizobium galegae TaxID=399 RepID=UPI001AE15D91|nr:LysR family transcriptional regulator [Neorhizobium galegae]MBP2562543.1 DNA-binding transcriptional LysR family regulator [Neorhizobium galegae]